MGKIIKVGKVVVILQGRFAGRKAVVVKMFDDGTSERRFGHALVAGVDRLPRRVTRSMTKKTILNRSKVKPFVRFVNYTHIMPTRYSVDVDLSNVSRWPVDSFSGVEKEDSSLETVRDEVRTEVKKII